jgi:hypothetical protein
MNRRDTEVRPVPSPAPQWQICFDDGHQQRYLPDRQAVLRYVLAIAPKAASKRFEVFTEAAPVLLSDGTPGGRSFALAEVIDLSRPGEAERLRAELAALEARPGGPAPGAALGGQAQGGRS